MLVLLNLMLGILLPFIVGSVEKADDTLPLASFSLSMWCSFWCPYDGLHVHHMQESWTLGGNSFNLDLAQPRTRLVSGSKCSEKWVMSLACPFWKVKFSNQLNWCFHVWQSLALLPWLCTQHLLVNSTSELTLFEAGKWSHSQVCVTHPCSSSWVNTVAGPL